MICLLSLNGYETLGDSRFFNKNITRTYMTNGWFKVPHYVYEEDLNIWEREMLIYLLKCENKFQKEGDWIWVSNDEFISIGFGKDKRILKETKDSLVSKGFIEYKKGVNKNKSQYKIL